MINRILRFALENRLFVVVGAALDDWPQGLSGRGQFLMPPPAPLHPAEGALHALLRQFQ